MNKALYEELYPKIYNYVYYRILHKETAEDITGEVFYKAIANAALFDEQKASYATWLFAIAHNLVLKFYRDKKDVISFEEFSETSEIPSLIESPDNTLIADEDTRRLHTLLKTLTERERTILALRFWGEFSYKDIAKQINLSEKNVSVILSRTITKLKELW